MKILYVVSRPLEINTSSSVRNKATIMGLVANSNVVHLITTEPDKNHTAYDESMCISDNVPTKYVRLSGTQTLARAGRRMKFLKPLKSIVYRFMKNREVYDNLKGFVTSIDEVDLDQEKYDMIISSSDPKSSHLFVYELLKKNEFAGKWIQIWGDPFVGDITQTNKKKIKQIEIEERKLLSRADKIFYVSKLTLEEQKERYPESAEKMSYIPIPYFEERISNIKRRNNDNSLKLAYCGDYISTTRNIYPLYEAVKELNNIELTVCGGSDVPLKTMNNVTVMDRVSHDRVAEIEREADVLVHLSNLKGGQIPGKIYQYCGTNKPILFILDGNKEKIKSMFSPYGRFTFADNTKESIAEAIKRIETSSELYAPVKEFSKEAVARIIVS